MKKWLKILIAVGIIAFISLLLFLVFKVIGITDVYSLQQIIAEAGAWGVLVYMLLYIIVNCFCCFIPATSMTFLTIGIICFGANSACFVVCYLCVLLTSFIMDAIGRFGGSKLIKRLIGEEEYNNAYELLQTKGAVYVPVMYLLPVFPDDAICMVSGALKVKWWVHYLEIALFRGIGCATIIFGINLLPYELMDNLKRFNKYYIMDHFFDYITIITVLAFWVIVLFKIARKIDKWLSKKGNKANENKTIEPR